MKAFHPPPKKKLKTVLSELPRKRTKHRFDLFYPVLFKNYSTLEIVLNT